MNLQQILCNVNVKLKNDFFMFSVSLEYGALHSWGCKQITPLKATDPDDTHYLNKDGKLYVIDKEPHDQDNYCIENTSIAKNSTQVTYIQAPSHNILSTSTFNCRLARFSVLTTLNTENQLDLITIRMDCRFHAYFWHQL